MLDANLNTVTGSGSTGASIAANLDAWGVHRLRAIGQTVTMEAIDGSTSEQFACSAGSAPTCSPSTTTSR